MPTYIVIRVEHPSNVFRKVAVQHCLDVVSVVDCSEDYDMGQR